MDRPAFMTFGTQAEYYQLVLAATYHADGLWSEATFDLYARDLPAKHGYYVAAGLGPLLEQLHQLSFSEDEVARLRADPVFARIEPSFFDALLRFRFEGEVWAVPEGTVMFPHEPMVRITAPLIHCTLIETRVIQILGSSSGIASRVARMVEAAEGRPVLDFGSRRAAGPEAALLASRAAVIGGVSATTNALAAARYGVTAMGTMADTFLAAYGDEKLALAAYRMHFPDLCHLNLPDDDPVGGLARYRPFASEVHTVRVDHPDLDRVSRQVRAALDTLGMKHTRILGSGHLDEHAIRALVRADAPIQLFAVGRALATIEDHSLRMAFRIAERLVGARPTPVRHAGGATWPGRKQVYRAADGDVIGLERERGPTGTPLLQRVWADGKAVTPLPSPSESRAWRARLVAALPPGVRRLDNPDVWPVTLSDAVAALAGGA